MFIVYIAAVAGVTMRGLSALRIASELSQVPASTFWAFGQYELSRGGRDAPCFRWLLVQMGRGCAFNVL